MTTPAYMQNEPRADFARILNNYRANRLGQDGARFRRDGDTTPSHIWWDSCGDWLYRLLDYRTYDVIGTIQGYAGPHGRRYTARKHASGATNDFDTAWQAAEWVEDPRTDAHTEARPEAR
jgi:hypothetical protein